MGVKSLKAKIYKQNIFIINHNIFDNNNFKESYLHSYFFSNAPDNTYFLKNLFGFTIFPDDIKQNNAQFVVGGVLLFQQDGDDISHLVSDSLSLRVSA